MSTNTCEFCKEQVYADLSCCPHCGQPSLFPNVVAAQRDEEVRALNARYEEAIDAAGRDGKLAAAKELERFLSCTTAFKSLPGYELQRLVSADGAVAATYYQQIDGRCRLPDNDRWDRLRRIADAAIQGSFANSIHFGALTTDMRWLPSYGDGALFFRDQMISHRATVFEDNTARWVEERTGNISIPPGHRASWSDRSRLGVAKLASSITSDSSEFSLLLLSPGKTTREDSYIEVHIYGSITVRSANALSIKKRALSELFRAVLEDRKTHLGLEVKEVE